MSQWFADFGAGLMIGFVIVGVIEMFRRNPADCIFILLWIWGAAGATYWIMRLL